MADRRYFCCDRHVCLWWARCSPVARWTTKLNVLFYISITLTVHTFIQYRAESTGGKEWDWGTSSPFIHSSPFASFTEMEIEKIKKLIWRCPAVHTRALLFRAVRHIDEDFKIDSHSHAGLWNVKIDWSGSFVSEIQFSLKQCKALFVSNIRWPQIKINVI